MKKTTILLLVCGLMMSLLASPVWAIPGDVNGDGTVGFPDVVCLINYLFRDGDPPINPIDADVDGSPGINIRDVLQLIGHLAGGCDLLPYTGVSVRVGSDIRFSSDLISIAEGSTRDTTTINIIANGGPDLTGMVIPLSFQSEGDELVANLAEVSFDGTIVPPDWATTYDIDNDEKTLLLFLYADNSTDTPLAEGTTGLVVTLYFDQVVAGMPLAMSVTDIELSHSLTLTSAYCADGTLPSERIFSPMLSLALNGDVNCDGIVNVGDAIYTLNYLFKNGPPPCEL
jgi:hypothetical protein